MARIAKGIGSVWRHGVPLTLRFDARCAGDEEEVMNGRSVGEERDGVMGGAGLDDCRVGVTGEVSSPGSLPKQATQEAAAT